jgi:hypothetical protein
MNQNVTPSYRPPAPVTSSTAIGTNLTFHTGGTARPRRTIAVQATRASMSPPAAYTDRATVGADPGLVGIGGHWNQPKAIRTHSPLNFISKRIFSIFYSFYSTVFRTRSPPYPTFIPTNISSHLYIIFISLTMTLFIQFLLHTSDEN